MNPSLRHRRLVDAGIAGVLAVLLLPASVGLVIGARAGTVALFVVAAAGLVTAVALRREAPWVTFWVSSGAMLLLTALSLPDGIPMAFVPVGVLFLVSVHTLVAETPHRVVPLVVAGAGLALVMVRAVAVDPGETEWTALGTFAAATVLAVGFSWALGAYQRTRRQYVASLEVGARQAEALREQSVREGVARERERIAHEVHDVVAHSLAVVVTQSDAALMAMDHDPARARPMLEAVRDTGRDAMGEIRSALTVLRGSRLETAPVRSLDDVAHLVDSMRDKGLRVWLEVVGDPVPVSTDLARAAYRIVQESVTNALKHGGDRVTCMIRLEHRPEQVQLTITDDGPGFDPDAQHTGLGLVGMRERSRQLGAELHITSGTTGTTLDVRLPTR